MALKPQGGVLTIKEQIIQDPVSGLTLQFALVPGSDAPMRLKIVGPFPNGNRQFLFNSEGGEAGAETALGDVCPPSWLRDVTEAEMAEERREQSFKRFGAT